MPIKLYIVGDESVARSMAEERFIECYVVLKADTSADAPFELTRALSTWRDAYRPAPQATPVVSPSTFCDAAFSDGNGKWNTLREPKWQGLVRTLKATPALFSSSSDCQALFSPIKMLLQIIQQHATAIIIVDSDISTQKEPGNLAQQRRACVALTDCVAALGLLPDTTVDLLFDRDDSPRTSVRKSLLSTRRRRWTTSYATREVLGDGVEFVRRAFLAQCWACANGLPSIDANLSLGEQDRDLFESVMTAVSVTASQWLEQWSKKKLHDLPDEQEHLRAYESALRTIASKQSFTKKRPLDRLYQALRDSVRHGMSELDPRQLYRGPETLEADLAPVMMCPDFMAGLYGFFEYVRHSWRDTGTGPPRALSAVEVDLMRRAIGHGGQALPRSGEAVLKDLLPGVQCHVRRI